jgi:hypothetical protein
MEMALILSACYRASLSANQVHEDAGALRNEIDNNAALLCILMRSNGREILTN